MEQSRNMNPETVIDLAETTPVVPDIVSPLTDAFVASSQYHHIEWDNAVMAGNTLKAEYHLEQAENALNGKKPNIARTALNGLKRLFTRVN